MATYRHPATGVELNEITIRRDKISGPKELETLQILINEGVDQHIIAAMFGTNQGRVAEALKRLSMRRDVGQPDFL